MEVVKYSDIEYKNENIIEDVKFILYYIEDEFSTNIQIVINDGIFSDQDGWSQSSKNYRKTDIINTISINIYSNIKRYLKVNKFTEDDLKFIHEYLERIEYMLKEYNFYFRPSSKDLWDYELRKFGEYEGRVFTERKPIAREANLSHIGLDRSEFNLTSIDDILNHKEAHFVQVVFDLKDGGKKLNEKLIYNTMRYLKTFESFLLESKVVLSDKFVKILSSMDSDIAKELISLNNNDADVNFNYIDVLDNGNISFISDKLVDKFPEWGGNRQDTPRIGKFVTNLLGKKISNVELEKFVKDFKDAVLIYNTKSESNNDKRFDGFKLVNGDELVDIYQKIPYEKEDGIGQLGKSCMNQKPISFFELYRKNPGVVSLIVLYNEDNEFIGRCLLWNTANGFKFMDRIYTYKETDIQLFKLYGDKMGYYYKEKQNTSYMNRNDFEYKFNVISNGEVLNENYVVQLTDWEVTYYPYLDSLCYFNSETGQLSNSRWEIDADLLLANTDGGYKDSDFEWVF